MTTVLEQVSPAARFAAIADFAPPERKRQGGFQRRSGTTVTITKQSNLCLPRDVLRGPGYVTVDYSASTRTLRVRPATTDRRESLKVSKGNNTVSLMGTLAPLGLAGKRLRWRTRYIVDGVLYLPLDEAEVTG